MARHGLLIGVSRFDDSRLSALNAPRHDVNALAEVLRDPARGGFDAIDISLDEDYLAVRDRLAGLFEDRDPDDLVLLYYSGHGILRRGNRLFLATPASDLKRPQARSIAAGEVRDLMDQCRAERQVLILDCCHSGAFGEHAKGGPAPAVTDDTFAAAGAGRYVLTASDSQQFAWDGGELKEGAAAARKLSSFTSWLVQGIAAAEAAPDEPEITLDALFRYVCRRARAEGAAATPQSFVDRATGELVIAHNPSAAGNAEVAALAVQLGADDWAVRNSAAETLGRLARRSATREAAREALADRLGIERDFKVRGTILKALELRDDRSDAAATPPPQSPNDAAAPAPAAAPLSSREMGVLRQANIAEKEWPRLPPAVVDYVRLLARAAFWGRIAVWVAGGMAVIDVSGLVQIAGRHQLDDAVGLIAWAVAQLVVGAAYLIPGSWFSTVPAPALTGAFAALATIRLVRFRQIGKWPFDPVYDKSRLRRAAIISLVAGSLTLAGAGAILTAASGDASPTAAPGSLYQPQPLLPGTPSNLPASKFNMK